MLLIFKKGYSVCLRVPEVPGSRQLGQVCALLPGSQLLTFPMRFCCGGSAVGLPCAWWLLNPQSSSYSHWFRRLRRAAPSLPHIGICSRFDQGTGSSDTLPAQTGFSTAPAGGSQRGPHLGGCCLEGPPLDPPPTSTPSTARCLPAPGC